MAHRIWQRNRKLYRLQSGVSRHQPFNTLALERHLQTAMLAAAFHIDDGAFTKLSVAYALAELIAAVVLDHRRTHTLMADRAAYRGAQAHLFHTLFRQLTDKARRAMVNLFAIQTAGFRVGQRQFLHRAGYANVRLHPATSGLGTCPLPYQR